MAKTVGSSPITIEFFVSLAEILFFSLCEAGLRVVIETPKLEYYNKNGATELRAAYSVAQKLLTFYLDMRWLKGLLDYVSEEKGLNVREQGNTSMKA